MSDTIESTLIERGKRYGSFDSHADITQEIKEVMHRSGAISDRFVVSQKWISLSASQKEALDMIAHKIGRILNGDPNYADSWHDIAGYAKLVEDELNDSIVKNTLPFSPSQDQDKIKS